jgi:methyl-accepting chemotaxis protein
MKKISQQLSFVVFLFVSGFFIFAGLSYITLIKYSVNGPVYDQVVKGKDLIADVLPPPVNLLESYLIVHQMSDDMDDSHRESLMQKMHLLKKEYMTRHEFWKNQNLEKDISTYLLQESYVPTKDFYDIFFDKLVPAVKSKNAKDFALILQDLEKKYQLHQQALQKVVKLTTEQNQKLEATTASHLRNSKMIEIVVFALIIISATFVAFFIVRRITKSLNHIKSVIESMASNDFTSNIQVFSQDEIGEVLKSLILLQQKISQVLQQVVSNINATKLTAGEMASGNLDLSNRTESQAGVVQNMNAAIATFAKTLEVNEGQVSDIDKQMKDAVSVAKNASDNINVLLKAMNIIQEYSKKALDMVSVIDGIAFQTNILALNAAVEAAHAGEQGRGFSVVASEVRNLAQHSTSAAKEIQNLITASVEVTKNGFDLANQAGAIMQQLLSVVNTVSEGMVVITVESQNQTITIHRIVQSIEQIDETTQQNAALVEEAASIAANLEQETQALGEAVSIFKVNHND